MDFLANILAQKEIEVAKMQIEPIILRQDLVSFIKIVKENPQRMHVIGEIKRASPSKGDINLTADILVQAKTYELAKVSAISVLTDPIFFKGSITDLKKIAKTVQVPILCKDFIISKKQINRAYNAGASLVLLIVAALPQANLKELFDYAKSLQLEVLVECHNAGEITRAKALGAVLIGVNNRNLTTFEVSIDVSIACDITDEGIYISESGFKTQADVNLIKDKFHGVLVGETLMRSSNPSEKIQELQVSCQ